MIVPVMIKGSFRYKKFIFTLVNRMNKIMRLFSTK